MDQQFVLLFLGGSVLLSVILARVAVAARAPIVVGYIVAGALLGPDLLGAITTQQAENLGLINRIVLSLIGFGIGGELKFSELRKLGKTIISVVLCEAIAAFVLVSLAAALLVGSLPMGILFGVMAAATAPAGTVDVIVEYKAKGNFTTALYAVIGLDDVVALMLYSIFMPIGLIYLGTGNASVMVALEHAGREISLSVLAGVISGAALAYTSKYTKTKTDQLLLTLGMVLINCGIAWKYELSPILLNMVAGIFLVNRSPVRARKLFTALGDWTPPMYVWFFVLIGTHLDIALIKSYYMLIIVYVVMRSLGKWSGTWLGASLAHSPANIRKYLGLALGSQSGVAVGLALAATDQLHKAGLHSQATQLISVITATTFIVMFVGPIMAKVALFRSGDVKLPLPGN